MNVVFMGTPQFACPALETLFASRHNLLAVVTGPDKPAGRGQKLTPCRVKINAAGFSLPVYQPENLRDDAFIAEMAALNPEIFVVIAFRILPGKLYSLPSRGSINIHASLLPKYRGAAPINHALLNGESETGLTSFFLAQKVDRGEIIHQVSIPIDPDETYSELSTRLAARSGPFLLETLDLIESPDFEPKKQDHSRATAAPKIKPEDALIEWDQPRQKVHNQVRAFSERPGAYTFLDDKKLKILKSHLDGINELPNPEPGGLRVKDKKLYVGTADNPLEIISLQMQGRRVMNARAFLNGYRIEDGDRFESRRKGVNMD